MKGKVIIMDKDKNSYYLDNVKSKINKLNQKKDQYDLEISQHNLILEENAFKLQKLKFEKGILEDDYNNLLNLLQKDGIVFEINFSQYKPHQWENLFIAKVAKGYEIQTKSRTSLMMLDKDVSKIIVDINKKDSYSLIVIRVTDKTALVQLRFR
jgi:hypothetical protein